MADILFTKRLFAATASGGSGGGNVDDVTVNGQSVVSNKVAKIVKASTSNLGVVKVDGTTITIDSSGTITSVGGGGSGAKLYTLDGLSITSTNTDIRTLVQAVVAKDLPIGSIVTGSVQLTDAPADNMTDAMVEIVAYQLTEGTSTDTIYDITLNSRTESPYQWHAEYWVSHPTADVGWSSAPLAFYNMPTASATYGTNGGKIVQYVGPGDGIHVTGKFYKCQEVTPVTDPATYEWVLIHVEPVASSSDFGIVKPDGSTITISNGIISAQAGGSEEDNLTITKNASDKIQTVAIIDQRSGYDKVWSGTLAQYNAISTKDANTIYVVDGADDYSIQVYTMPVASSSYENVAVQYLGATTSDYEQGLWYICEENPTDTWNWVNLLVDPIATASDFGLVKVDNSSIVANSGVISANKATGAYSTTFVGNPATTNSSTNVGANSEVFGYYSVSLGCDAIVGDSANSVRVPGAIQLGRGSNTEAGSLSVGLSVNGTSWNNYKLLGSDGVIPTDRIDFPVDDVQINGTSILSSGVANIPLANAGAGVVRANGGYGTGMQGEYLTTAVKTYEQYQSMGNTGFIGKGTLENVIAGKIETQTATITDGTTLTLANNYVYSNSTAIASLTIAYPTTYTSAFCAEVNFVSGSTATSLTLPASIIMKGDDVSNSVFTPVANASYSVMFSSTDGSNKVGIVIKIA